MDGKLPNAEPKSQPLLVRELRVGQVREIVRLLGFGRGRLELDRLAGIPEIDSAVAMAKAVDAAPAEEYLVAWHEWQQACAILTKAGVKVGEVSRPVESFSIESDLTVEWVNVDPDAPWS